MSVPTPRRQPAQSLYAKLHKILIFTVEILIFIFQALPQTVNIVLINLLFECLLPPLQHSGL